ncbi:FtsK/SpoIIIE domain-containing protein [Pseudonocardia xishanensis]|uniref:FtsK domain-containing protein n=1 Tax=Pseudonocardia xishanensis TaxID=630995 RepID=A0ABP8RCY3_9PSEU
MTIDEAGVSPRARMEDLSTLETLARTGPDIAQASAVVDAAMKELVAAAADACRAWHPTLADDLRRARGVAAELSEAFTRRWGAAVEMNSAVTPLPVETIPEWIDAAERMIDTVARAYVPLRQSKRDQARWLAAAAVAEVLKARERVEYRAAEEAFDRYRARIVAELDGALGERSEAVDRASRAVVLPAGTGGLDDLRLLDAVPRAGVGPLRLAVGALERPECAVMLSMAAPSVRNRQVTRLVLRTVPNRIPLIIDLDRHGGLITDDPGTATSLLLRMLALLPAGRLRADVFDPQALGDSVRPIFALGDDAVRVIGNKVRTDARELGQLLAEIEDHLTFVTQKYLGGTYTTLTDYNAAAGEVAEPYRLLMLYDFPRGFRRPDGSRDEDVLDRLNKIVEAGPRCGVFTVVVAPAGDAEQVAQTLGAQLPTLNRDAVLDRALVRGLTALGPTALTEGIEDLRGCSSDVVSGLAAGATPFLQSVLAPLVFRPDPDPDPRVVEALIAHIGRGLATVDDVRVGVQGLHRLALAAERKAAERGLRAPAPLADPADVLSWWRGDSTSGISAAFGRVGAAEVGELTFASEFPSALLGGRPGAGKSVMLHAILGSLVRRYGPDQLELYLVDMREGVEFQVYAAGGLPQAKVVAVESDREFALSVLRSIEQELERRGEILRRTGGEQVELAGYRRTTGQPMPRTLVVIDEFHMLFTVDDAIASEAGRLLDRIIRQGRGFGIHALLASQTLDGMIALGKHTLRLVPVRVALQSDEADSRIILGEENPDARLLTRPGEGILNRRGGLRDANERFQAVFSDAEEREQLVRALRALADGRGHTARPAVFESRRLSEPDDTTIAALRGAVSSTAVAVPVGLPMTLGGPVALELRREAGGNLLVVADEERARAVLALTIVGCASGGGRIHVLDLAAAGEAWPATLERIAPLGGPVTTTRRNGLPGRLRELADLVAERTERSELRAAPVLLVVCGLHRARDLDVDDYSDDGPHALLHRILVDGPDVGVHVVAWTDKRAGLERRLRREAQREFAVRLAGRMSAEDSRVLIDDESAAGIPAEQLVLDDQDRSTRTKVRAYAAPTQDWLDHVVGR